MVGAELVGRVVKLSPAFFAFSEAKGGKAVSSYARDLCDRALYLGLAPYDWIEPRAEVEFLSPNWGRAIIPARFVEGLADREKGNE